MQSFSSQVSRGNHFRINWFQVAVEKEVQETVFHVSQLQYMKCLHHTYSGYVSNKVKIAAVIFLTSKVTIEMRFDERNLLGVLDIMTSTNHDSVSSV